MGDKVEIGGTVFLEEEWMPWSDPNWKKLSTFRCTACRYDVQFWPKDINDRKLSLYAASEHVRVAHPKKERSSSIGGIGLFVPARFRQIWHLHTERSLTPSEDQRLWSIYLGESFYQSSGLKGAYLVGYLKWARRYDWDDEDRKALLWWLEQLELRMQLRETDEDEKETARLTENMVSETTLRNDKQVSWSEPSKVKKKPVNAESNWKPLLKPVCWLAFVFIGIILLSANTYDVPTTGQGKWQGVEAPLGGVIGEVWNPEEDYSDVPWWVKMGNEYSLLTLMADGVFLYYAIKIRWYT